MEERTCREWLPAGHRARNPRRALRWTRARARRLADRIDPPPYAGWSTPGTVHPCTGGPPDAAGALRHRHLDTAAHHAALRTLADGGLHVLTVPDGDGLRYRISVRPLR